MIGASITATPEARAAIARVVKDHGPIMFHTSGGRVGGRAFPACFPADALRIGARDHFLGEVEGVPVYDMEDRDGVARSHTAKYVLDVVDGVALGFSFAAAPGKRFSLRQVTAGSNGCGGDGGGSC